MNDWKARQCNGWMTGKPGSAKVEGLESRAAQRLNDWKAGQRNGWMTGKPGSAKVEGLEGQLIRQFEDPTFESSPGRK